MDHINKTLKTAVPVHQRLIMALDVPDFVAAKRLIDQLGDAVDFYKIGLELWASGSHMDLIELLVSRDKRIFADLKLYDVPATVERAVKNLSVFPIDFLTVHGNGSIMNAAASAKGGLRIMAVTVLTSLDQGDLEELGFSCDTQALVLSRARKALASGCDGVISSGLEIESLRLALGDDLTIVVPGIRPVDVRAPDDQKRTVSASGAFKKGADYIVVGRPIRDASDPYVAASEIQREIARYFQR